MEEETKGLSFAEDEIVPGLACPSNDWIAKRAVTPYTWLLVHQRGFLNAKEASSFNAFHHIM